MSGESIPSRPSRRTVRTEAGWLAAALLAALVWTSIPLWWKPEVSLSDAFLLSEPGQNLLIADRLLAGERLYGDIFTPYGALPIMVYTGLSALFGNTATTYLGLFQALSLLTVALCYALLRRQASSPLTAAWIALALFPLVLVPGFSGEAANTLYPPFERVGLLILALLWTVPQRRGPRRALLLGLVLGGMQFIKFGGAFVAGAALLTVDALVLGHQLWREPAACRRWLKSNVLTLGGFTLLESARAAWVFSYLPTPWAKDHLWPAYMMKHYQAVTRPDSTALTYFEWVNPRYFFGVQLVSCLGLGLALLVGVKWLAPRSRLLRGAWPEDAGANRVGPSLFLSACFALGVLTHYLPHRWSVFMWIWLPVTAALPALAGFRPALRAGVLLLVGVVTAYTQGRALLSLLRHSSDGSLAAVDFPCGERLWFSPKAAQRWHRVQALVADHAAKKLGEGSVPRVMGLPFASGWAHYTGDGTPLGTRHFCVVPAFVRPEEEPLLATALEGCVAVVLFNYAVPLPMPPAPPVTADPRSWGWYCNPEFSATTNAAFAAHLGAPVRVDEQCVVFPVR